jgi:putative membrane protein
MSWQQISFGLIEFLVSIVISFFLIFGSYRLFLALTPKIDEEKQLKAGNTSVGLILGSTILGEAIVVKQAIYPVMAVIQIFVLGQDRNVGNFLKMIGFSIGYVVLVGFLALASILFSFWLFNKMTPRINQYEEIKNNNIAVALFMAFFIVAICFLVSSGVSGLARALIPFPEIGSIPLS